MKARVLLVVLAMAWTALGGSALAQSLALNADPFENVKAKILSMPPYRMDSASGYSIRTFSDVTFTDGFLETTATVDYFYTAGQKFTYSQTAKIPMARVNVEILNDFKCMPNQKADKKRPCLKFNTKAQEITTGSQQLPNGAPTNSNRFWCLMYVEDMRTATQLGSELRRLASKSKGSGTQQPSRGGRAPGESGGIGSLGR